MSKRKHHTHSPEFKFKFKLMVEVLKGGKSRAEIARENDITRSLLHKWEQAFLEKGAKELTSFAHPKRKTKS